MAQDQFSLEDVVSVQPAPAQRPVASHGAAPRRPATTGAGGGGLADYVRPFARLVRENLDTGGAMAGAYTGGKLGAPFGPWGIAGGAALGAGIGGALGEGATIADEALQGRPSTGGQAASRMAREGLGQAAAEATGTALLKGAAKVAHPLYYGLLKQTPSKLKEFGDVVPTALREGIPIGKRGVRAADAALDRSVAEADRMIAAQQGRHPRVRQLEVGQEWLPTIDELRKRAKGGEVSELPAAYDRWRRFDRQMGSQGVDVVEAQELKRSLQKVNDQARRSAERGGQAPSADAMLAGDTARGFQRAIEARVPKIGEQNRRSRDLMGLLETLEDSGYRSPMAVGGMRDAIAMSGGALAGSANPAVGGTLAAIMRALQSPALGSRAAIGLHRGGQYAPELVQGGRALAGLMSSHGDKEP